MQLELAQIRTDGGTQPREIYHFGIVDTYAEDMDAGATFPPITVFYDGTDYWLADGFHRVLATRKVGRDTIEADVRQGTLQDAQWYSYSVNRAHGLRRSNEDKRRAVEAALRHPRAAGMSDREVADHCGVHHGTVGEIRNRMTGGISQSTGNGYRTGRDGVKRKVPNGKKTESSKPDASPPIRQDEDKQVIAAYTNGSAAPTITEPVSVGEERLTQMVNELIQQLNFADFRRFIELAAARIAIDV